MPQSVQARTQGRFPASVVAGDTGQGALDSQGHARQPQQPGESDPAQYYTLPGYEPETVAQAGIPLLEGTWGLAGGTDYDATPRTHAAPSPGHAGSYDDPELLFMHDRSQDIHAAEFGALARHTDTQNVGGEREVDDWSSISTGENVLQPVRGPLQAMGGYDTSQGYDTRNGYDFDAAHRARSVDVIPQPMAYLDPAERPFIVPQASGAFTPTDLVQGPEPWAPSYDAPGLNATPQTAYAPPADDAAAPAPAVTAGAAVPSAGWGLNG